MTTTSTTAAPVITEAPPAPTVVRATTTSSPPDTQATARGPGSPAEAAQGFYDAWQAGSRSAAREFASELAIAELFSNPGGGMELYGCRQTAQDLFDCPFRYEGGALHMDVYGDYVNGHKVEDVRYMVD